MESFIRTLINCAPEPERVITVRLSVNSSQRSSDLSSLSELNELVEGAGGKVVHSLLQSRHDSDPRTLLGKGKIAEVSRLRESLEADTVVVDNVLSPSQQKNIEKETGVRVLDRTAVILQIFAKRARSREAMLQVEL